jgi:SET domain-containing protein
VLISFNLSPSHCTGGGSEQTAEDDSNSDVVKFVVMKDISLSEELFIDYGQSYDRSLYDSPDSQ